MCLHEYAWMQGTADIVVLSVYIAQPLADSCCIYP